MESLKKIINLNQASKISGYSQDYLGYLIRNGDIKAKKVGRGWATTEEEVNNYIFKQKVRHEKFAIRGFFSPSRRNNIFLITMIFFVGVFGVIFYITNFQNSNDIATGGAVNKTLSSDVEAAAVIKQ
ncbi:MAG: hypothetical protein AAB681_01440 [Patescibacteria group bacterium]